VTSPYMESTMNRAVSDILSSNKVYLFTSF